MDKVRFFKLLDRWFEYALRTNTLEALKAELSSNPEFAALRQRLGSLLDTAPVPEPASPLTPFSVANNQILFNGRLWKGLGMNFRELAFYGLGVDPVRWTSDTHFFQQLDGARDKGAKIIRIYCSHPQFSVEQAVPRVRRVLDEAQKRGLYVILCISDAAPAGQFYVPESPDLKSGRYTWKWILGGYRSGNYYQYVDKLTSALGAHPAIFAWEPLNELTALDWGDADTTKEEGMLAFWKDITKLIRANSPTKLISNGNVSSWELFVDQAYAGGKYALRMAKETELNLISFHSYMVGGDDMGAAGEHIRNEVSLIKSSNVGRVAFILGETAAQWDANLLETSSDPIRRQADALFPLGFAAILLWGVSFPYGHDIGVHGSGYPNWNSPPLSTRWHNVMGWFEAVSKQLASAYS